MPTVLDSRAIADTLSPVTPPPARILFTAFEPSGDRHAAPVIAELRRRFPSIEIHALGGEAMQNAGATLIEQTTEDAAMLGNAIRKAVWHRRLVRLTHRWLSEHPVIGHVPVDSPAANWAMCKAVRRRWPNAKVIHLVAPQLWAWAKWRLPKLRRATDRVMCLLPFEPDWFERHRVPAVFVGHPLFDRPITDHVSLEVVSRLGGGGRPRIALLPGSREAEIRANWPTMLEVYRRLAEQHPHLHGVVAAVNAKGESLVRELSGSDWIASLQTVVGETDSALAWSDLTLAVSGTATLQVAAHHKPMVVLYNIEKWSWLLVGRHLVDTRTFSLPNLIGESVGLGRVVPEFVPHFGDADPVFEAVNQLASDPAARDGQSKVLAKVCDAFAGPRFAEVAADQVTSVLNLAAHTAAAPAQDTPAESASTAG